MFAIFIVSLKYLTALFRLRCFVTGSHKDSSRNPLRNTAGGLLLTNSQCAAKCLSKQTELYITFLMENPMFVSRETHDVGLNFGGNVN